VARGWQTSQGTNRWIYVSVALLAIVAALVVAILLGFNGPGGELASATSTPTIPPGPATSTGVATDAATAGAPTSPAPSSGSTPAITPATPAGTPAPGATGAPGASTKPTLVSITIPHKANCLGDNGTGQIGSITIGWTTTGATGVRISIDPPTAASAYDYGYGDYPDNGSTIVPFACGSPLHDSGGTYHLYVVTTLHTSGYYQYRYQKVYQSPAPSATP